VKFLRKFTEENGNIFTTNYDLLLYWAIMENQSSIKSFLNDIQSSSKKKNVKNCLDFLSINDGFSKENNKMKWIEGKYNQSKQNVYYLHGALHLFAEDNNTYKINRNWNNLFCNLLTQIHSNLDRKTQLLIILEGDSQRKLEAIN